MGHGEDRVGPVGVGRALVAVRDPAVGGHPRADLGDVLVGDLPDAHAVGAEAGAAVEEDRGDAAQQAAVDHRAQVLDQRVDAHAQLRRRRRVGLGDHGRSPCVARMTAMVELVVGLLLELDRLLGHGRLGQLVGAAHELEVHADLEQLERRELADRLGAGELLQHVEGAVEAERGVLLHGEREPHVEVVVAQVVVAHARVRVDDPRGAPRVLGVDLRRDEHRAVAERAGVEDRRDLADDALVDELADARQHALLGHLERRRDGRVGPRLDREAALHRVEQALVEVVERDRRAVLAGAELGRH